MLHVCIFPTIMHSTFCFPMAAVCPCADKRCVISQKLQRLALPSVVDDLRMIQKSMVGALEAQENTTKVLVEQERALCEHLRKLGARQDALEQLEETVLALLEAMDTSMMAL